MFAAYGVAMGLLARERMGRGQFIDVGMLDSVAAVLTYQAGICFATGQAPPRLGNQHPTIVPYETLTAADGDIVVAVGNDALFVKFCDVLGIPSLAEDSRFTTNKGRVENQDALRPLLGERVGGQSRQHWLARLKEAGVPCGGVRDLAEVLSDPQLAERMMVLPMTPQSWSDEGAWGACQAGGHRRRSTNATADARTAYRRYPGRIGL